MLSQDLKNEIIRYRRTLHRIPELGFEEYKTQAFIKNELSKMGFEIEEVAKTGIIALKRGKENKAIAFRADMDALAVTEKTELEYKSKHIGKMHACGHDGHMSILLGFALFIANIDLNKDVVLIFQPAEEGPGGAKLLVEEGYLKKYQVESIFGLHIYPGITEGKIGLTSGILMAQVGEIDVTIKATSSHGAMPQNGVDGIFVASQLIQLYQSIISRNIDPTEGRLLTIGKVTGGEARNILAKEVILNGTIRAFNSETYQKIKNRLTEINNGVEKLFGIKVETEIRDMYPALVNDHKLYHLMKDILSDDVIVELKPLMIAEDFSFYLTEVPGYFFMLGALNEELGYVHPLHSCYFNFREEILFHGVETYIKICQALNIF